MYKKMLWGAEMQITDQIHYFYSIKSIKNVRCTDTGGVYWRCPVSTTKAVEGYIPLFAKESENRVINMHEHIICSCPGLCRPIRLKVDVFHLKNNENYTSSMILTDFR